MKMTIKRETPPPGKEGNTFGRFFVNGNFFSYVVEDEMRPAGVKVPKLTCIPAGTYKVVLSMSNRFKKILPEVLNVENFLGIRLHGGRDSTDSEGCPCLGFGRAGDKLTATLGAGAKLVSVLQAAEAKGDKEHTLEILNPPKRMPAPKPTAPVP